MPSIAWWTPPPGFAAVRDGQVGAPVAAVGDHGGGADGVLRSGQLPRLVVVAVARQGPADRDDEPGVGVDDDQWAQPGKGGYPRGL